MYFVPDETQACGYYECPVCGMRFLSLEQAEEIPCGYCEQEIDGEIGPDEVMAEVHVKAKRVKMLEGEEVAMWDKLLSLALTGGDEEDWL